MDQGLPSTLRSLKNWDDRGYLSLGYLIPGQNSVKVAFQVGLQRMDCSERGFRTTNQTAEKI